MAPITLTRQQLYDRAWTTPIDVLAKELGLSGRGLGKLCARHDIPVPPRGYWAKKAAGKRVSQPPLRDVERGNRRIGFLGASTPAPTDPNAPEVDALIAFEKRTENHLAVADDLALTDERILKTQRLLARGKRGAAGLTATPAGALSIHTSRDQHERALRIMQAVITAFETRGFPVADTEDGATRVLILDEALGFGIEEQIAAVEHRVTFTEQKRIDQGFGYRPPKTDPVPSGRLMLVIPSVQGVRHRWAEGSQPLEEMLNKFLIGLLRAAVALKTQRAEAARRERERKEEERRRQEEAKLQAAAELRWREEQARIKRLERLANVRERHRRLSELVDEIQTAVGNVAGDSELGRWLAWATDHVKRSDPIASWRCRSAELVSLYYYGYDHDRIPETGFSEPETYGDQKVTPGIELTERPPRRSGYSTGLKVDLPEDLVLPYEWPQESDWYFRVFRVPASLLNRTLGYGAGQADDAADVDFKVLGDDADNA